MRNRSHNSTLQGRIDAASVRLGELIAAYNRAIQPATDITRICLLAKTINSQIEDLVRMRSELTDASSILRVSGTTSLVNRIAADDEEPTTLSAGIKRHVLGLTKAIHT